ncbi:thioester domain-containing protein [Umezawaea endophytica]|uniref:Thioester domain-containing protein n=1 Tax=Umezawaea endophytica TaxID=1654476 RepID=A0A9X2VV83_9PSEU|nr:thioester domain-containing protein [Umezawaea endophytica]MCS7483453.1 thioester domain-containing protein [Umezawaea endophytica]
MTSRLSASRIGAAVLGASLALLVSALPAIAEVHVKPKPEWDQRGADVFLEGKDKKLDTSLIGLEIDGTNTKVQAYCVELPTPLEHGRGLKEVPWDKHPNPNTKFKENADKIAWILQYTFPLVKAKELGAVIGKDLDENEAIGGTQAAIWHFSDGAKLDKGRVKNGDVVALYDYLTGEKNTGIKEQPTPTLTVEPKEKSGNAGDLIGPFTVTTTAGEVVLKADLPEGVVLADKNGNPLADPKAGTLAVQDAGTKTEEFYVKVPVGTPDGKASFSVEANAELAQGRLFVSSNDQLQTQSLVVAFPAKASLKAEGSVSWATAPASSTPPPSSSVTTPPTSTTESTPASTPPAPTTTTTPVPAGGSSGDLASTGASIFVPLIIGIVLVGGGAGALLVMRRRKSAP